MDRLRILSKQEKDTYVPIVKNFIRQSENSNGNSMIDLTGSGLNICKLKIILEGLGYDEVSSTTTFPFIWKVYHKDGYKNLSVSSDSTTFMLELECR